MKHKVEMRIQRSELESAYEILSDRRKLPRIIESLLEDGLDGLSRYVRDNLESINCFVDENMPHFDLMMALGYVAKKKGKLIIV